MRMQWAVTTKRWAAAALIAGLGMAGSASAALIARGADLVYDNVLNITWTRNANLEGSSNLTFTQANTWAADLSFAGYNDWRLPYASVVAGAGPITTLPFGFPCTGGGGADEVACRDNEMAYMFYYNLDGNQGDNKTSNQTALGGEALTNIQPVYWSGTEFISGDFAWGFFFDDGFQLDGNENVPLSAWAVRSGDVSAAVPEPQTVGLLLAGLGLLGWRSKRR